MKKLLFLCLIFFSAITLAQEETSKTPKIAIKIEKGETIQLRGISIKFKDVLEDSRCPKYTNCIWAGRAIVSLEVMENGKTETKKIILGQTQPNESNSKRLFSKGSYFIEVISLNPYPEEGKDKAPYTLLISEEK